MRGPRGLMPSPWMLDDKPLGVKVVFITVPRFHPAKPEPSSEPWKKCGSALSLHPHPLPGASSQSDYYKPLANENRYHPPPATTIIVLQTFD